jgi:DNA-binding transcriptional ArsR family regulator
MAHGRDHSDIGRLLEDVGYAQAAAQSFQALSAPSRLRILARLYAGPAPVNEIAERVGMEGSAVSHQLRLLRHLGLVVGQRAGRQVVYELHDDHVAELLEQVVSHVEHVRLGLAGRHRAAETATA